MLDAAIAAPTASADKRKGPASNSNATEANANALQRCEVFPSEDKLACPARATGTGSQDGSVFGGGVIRQTETVIVVPADTLIMIPAVPQK